MCLYNIRLEYAAKSKFLHTESGEVACLERAQNSTGWDLLYNFSSHLTVLFPSRQYNSWPLLLINFNCSLALILLIIQWFKWLSIYDELKHIKNKKIYCSILEKYYLLLLLRKWWVEHPYTCLLLQDYLQV